MGNARCRTSTGAPRAAARVARVLQHESRVDALHELLWDLVKEAGGDAVARLSVQHAALRQGQVEAPARARQRDVHEPPLLLDAVGLGQAVLVREQSLLEAAHEHAVKF